MKDFEKAFDTMVDFEQKYYDLVWYARKPPGKFKELQKHWPDKPKEVIETISLFKEDVERKYAEECKELSGPSGDWQHGFHSGALATIRMVLEALDPEVEDPMADFPQLDS